MGILDDAIREHLDLKRRRGAADSELQRLEDEAFGPPSRPGEPEFASVPDGAGGHENGDAADAETRVVEAPSPPEGGGAAEPEPAAAEHPVVEPAHDHTEPEPSQPESPGEPPEGPSESEELTAIYDQSGDVSIGIEDLDLDLDEADIGGEATPSEEAPAAPEEAPAAPEKAPASEPGASPPKAPIESLETVEHPFPDEIVEPQEPSPAPPSEPEEGSPGAAADQEARAGDEQQAPDDPLADTPDFLKDAPEDDELWFEQGKPKDFDF